MEPQPTTHPAAFMTEEQAEMLAALTHAIRPTWHTIGITRALEKAAHQADATTLALALLHAAKNPTNKTPAIINHPGPHWDHARELTGPPTPPKPSPTLGHDTSPRCPKHPNLHQWECRPCNQGTPPPPNFRAMIDAAKAQAKTNTPTPTDQDHKTA